MNGQFHAPLALSPIEGPRLPLDTTASGMNSRDGLDKMAQKVRYKETMKLLSSSPQPIASLAPVLTFVINSRININEMLGELFAGV
jgi:hypothetical protein